MGRNPAGGSVQHGEAWSAGLLGLPVCGTEQDADKALFVSSVRTSPAHKAQLDIAPVVMRYVLSSLVSFRSCEVGSTRTEVSLSLSTKATSILDTAVHHSGLSRQDLGSNVFTLIDSPGVGGNPENYARRYCSGH